MSNWIKKQLTNIAIALTNVEKTTLTQDGLSFTPDSATSQIKNQGSVMNDLLRGEVTQEVETMRWRMYSTFLESKKTSHRLVGYDEKGLPIMKLTFVGDENRLQSTRTDDTDGGSLIIVVDNTPIDLGIHETLDMVSDDNIITSAETFNIHNFIMTNFGNDDNSDGEIVYEDREGVDSDIDLSNLLEQKSVTIAENIKLNSTKESVTPLTISRELRPKFEIEKFSKKLHIKELGDKYLLEFYVSKYPLEYDITSRFFISAIKKLKDNPRKDSMFDIDTVHFISKDTVGVPDYLEFEYKIENLLKISEYNEYLVIKFIADVIKNGESIIEKYRNTELDEKYKNKEKR